MIAKVQKSRRKKYSFKLLWNASIIPEVIPVTLFFGFYSLAIFLINEYGINFGLSALSLVVPSVVLGLLLVFRTNTAYDRFWEARKIWGSQINVSRNLAQSITVLIPKVSDNNATEYVKVMQLITAFSIATKLHLRSEPIESQLIDYIEPEKCELLRQQIHPPLTILGWMKSWVRQRCHDGEIDSIQMEYLLSLVDIMGNNLGGCERILNTPIPLAYSLHLKHLIYIYCLVFPFQIVESLHWLTVFASSLVAFALFGIEEIGVEIQDPFGYDENDLPLDSLCNIIRNQVEEIRTTTNT